MMAAMARTTAEPLIVTPRSIATPLGPIWAAAGEQTIHVVTVPGASEAECLASLPRRRKVEIAESQEGRTLLDELAAELDDYFAGRRRDFSLPVEPLGTSFQRLVWDAVRAIPYGETRTYAGVAATIGRPTAIRAMGAANGANPLAIIVPCHRVIGSDGKLRGYGGGLPMKEQLLAMERGFASQGG